MSITLRGYMHETTFRVDQPLPSRPGELVIVVETGSANLQTYATPEQARHLAQMFVDAAEALERQQDRTGEPK